MDNETPEETYTAKDFGKDVAKVVAIDVTSMVAAVAVIGAIGISIQKVQSFRERRAAKKAATEI